MDLKHILSMNPTNPVYRPREKSRQARVLPLRWVDFAGGLVDIGHRSSSFAYDNEMPSHQVFLQPFQLANRCVTNGEYLEWMESGAYEKQEAWLTDGWSHVQREGWQAPLYWIKQEGKWFQFTLHGLQRIEENEPVVHVGFFEAEAFARWRGLRLPTEFEWEHAASGVPIRGNFVESKNYHPLSALVDASELSQIYGDVWELTQSPYLPYPGYRPEDGALGEYNGKFMSGQMVSRGGCCATLSRHLRLTYRNFFYPHERWAFQGIRLAKDVAHDGRV